MMTMKIVNIRDNRKSKAFIFCVNLEEDLRRTTDDIRKEEMIFIYINKTRTTLRLLVILHIYTYTYYCTIHL